MDMQIQQIETFQVTVHSFKARCFLEKEKGMNLYVIAKEHWQPSNQCWAKNKPKKFNAPCLGVEKKRLAKSMLE